MATVVLLGTLDTKGLEYAYLRDRVREHGVDTVLVDVGVLGEPLTRPDITREEVARAAGADVTEFRDQDAAAIMRYYDGVGNLYERLAALPSAARLCVRREMRLGVYRRMEIMSRAKLELVP